MTKLRHVFISLALAATALCAGPLRAAPLTIDVSRDDVEYRVTATAEVAADVQTAWDTLSDYEHLADFVPDVSSSRVIERTGDHLVVEYFGTLRYFIFSTPIAVRLAVEHTPMTRIVARRQPGAEPTGTKSTVESIESRYDIFPLAPQLVRITYSARFVPASALPRFIALRAVRRTVTLQFEAMLEEMLRRQSLLPPS